jgi:hypothetical protein
LPRNMPSDRITAARALSGTLGDVRAEAHLAGVTGIVVNGAREIRKAGRGAILSGKHTVIEKKKR